MSTALPVLFVLLLVPLLYSLVLTLILRRGAPLLGLVDRPSERKVHTRPVPKGGGLAMFLALALSTALFAVVGLPLGNWRWVIDEQALLRETGVLLGIGSAIVLLGFIDDLRPLPWQLRLAVQTATAAGAVALWPCEAGWLLRLLAVLWIVGLTNAFNMLDNMDALSGGVAGIAAALLAAAVRIRLGALEWLQAAPFVMLVGAVAGFLWFNRPPARVFMGDAGSTFLGFFLGVRSLDGGPVALADWRTWLVPVCVLALPWYDLIVVVAIRLAQGRSPFYADKQHLSHRLVARGLSPVAAVGVIHLLALASGIAGLWFYALSESAAILLAVGLSLCWTAGGVLDYLSWRRRGR